MQVKRKVVFVTGDRWVCEKGVLDPTDEEILKDAAQGGEVVVMNMRQAFEEMKKEEPEKFNDFKQEIEKTAGKPLTMDELANLGRRADEQMRYYQVYFANLMTIRQAKQIREWRVDQHYTWRSVARAAYGEVTKGEDFAWRKFRRWDPPSNQIVGMALCERAALILREDYRKEPWN